MRLLTSKLFQCAVILFLVGGLSCLASFAQGPAAPAMDSASSEPAPPPALPDAPSSAASTDSGWRGAVSLYGWFPGAHGVIGAHYYWTGVHAPFSDVFSYLHGAVPIAGEIDKGRWVIPVDFVWVRLEDSKSIAGFNTGQESVDATFTQTVFTPKIGYRVVDRDHVKVDALAGIRYWHIGYGFNLQPSGVGVSQSQSWVDGIGGARFIFPITEKASILLSGDAGAGGAESDYQGVGLFNYKFTPHIGLASVGDICTASTSTGGLTRPGRASPMTCR